MEQRSAVSSGVSVNARLKTCRATMELLHFGHSFVFT